MGVEPAKTGDDTAPAPPPVDAARTTGSSLLRSGSIMAAGTMVSRVSGFGRTVVLAAAVGTQLLGDAYNTANMIPFALYDLLVGGLMTGVLVPLLVKRRAREADDGRATEQRLATAAGVVLLALAAVAVLGAEWLIGLYAGGFTEPQFEVAVLLARYLLAQVFLVGLSGVLGAMLNVRGRFGAPMWAPVCNNLTMIAVGAAFLVVAGPGVEPADITRPQIALLGLGTVAGLLAQVTVLALALRSTDFRWRPRFDLRGSGLGEAVRAGGWMLVYVCCTQLGFVLTANLANRAGAVSAAGEAGTGAGLSTYTYAYQLFQLPYAVIAVSLMTALLPRMSDHAAHQRWAELRGDFLSGARTAAAAMVPLSLALAVVAVPLSQVVFARGATSAADAANIGRVLAVLAVGLVPFTVYQLMLRVFYAMGDTRTPAMLAAANLGVHAVLGTTAYLLLPPSRVVVGVAAGFMISYASGTLLAGSMLGRRLGGIGARALAGTLARLYVAAAPGTVAGLVTLGWTSPHGPMIALGATSAACLLGLAAYVVIARAWRVEEIRLLMARLRRT
ncbi:murein biosynthesis integral membrane protein MurJ [Nonomuraea basaltis]|uniref:murein biosynthesis integral membrane protein MurJ n=1 Tax=Nonomuraea basaltis TaxID=2495887 RepID=UPI00110C3FC2|nr:murein biosynthesis integral membrane protein MurJ [Nonomuraea basaltis]TMR95772.1 murein biosynthesis integral membrane protein MurJ [Nonomuraea basaltis]